MAFDILFLKNETTGEILKAPVGFSWTSLFFGPFPALIRADWLHGSIFFVAWIFTWGLANFVIAFIYNKLYIKHLIFKNGFKVLSSKKGNLQAASNELGLELPMIG